MVRNHVGIEALGIPTVSIVQEYFAEDAKASGEAFGLPDPTVAVVSDVFTSLTAQQTTEAVDDIIEDIIIGLTEPLPEPGDSVIQKTTIRGPRDKILEFTGEDLLKCLSKMNDKFLDWGWSDGFPLVPPTEEAVSEIAWLGTAS